jgi:hypothetical protein
MQAFFSLPRNQDVVQRSMSMLVKAMKTYDADKSMRLSKPETDVMFNDLFPSHLSNYERVSTELFSQVRVPSFTPAPQPFPPPPPPKPAVGSDACRNPPRKNRTPL